MTAVLNDWGDWLLGDLVAVGERVSKLVGPSQEVTCVGINAPGPQGLPHVLLVVPDEAGVEHLRDSVQSTEYVVEFTGHGDPTGWVAEVAGMEIRVQMREPTR